MRCGKRRSVRVKIGEVGKIAKREARAKAKVNYRDHVERLMADIAASTTLVSRCFHGEPPVRRGKSKSSSPPPRKRASGWAAWFRSAIGSTIGRSMSSRSMPSSCAMSFGVISRPAASCGSRLLYQENVRLPTRTDGRGKTTGGGLIGRGHLYTLPERDLPPQDRADFAQRTAASAESATSGGKRWRRYTGSREVDMVGV